jgi:hypothetical protein
MMGTKCCKSSPKALTPNMRVKSMKVECEGQRAREFNNKCTTRPLGVIPRASIYRVVKGLVNNVQTAPNRVVSHSKFIVMGLLQSFVIYKHFYPGPFIG